MKKIFSIVLCFLMALSVMSLAGCGEVKLKFGVGVYSTVVVASNAQGDTAGKGEADITVAAVLLDADGKISKCTIDSVSIAGEYTSDGKAVEAGEFKSKYELGDNYGMKKAGAKKEWYEQVDAFISVVKGKTIDEVKAYVAEGGKGAPDVVNAGCTIAIADFVFAIEKAVSNAKESDAVEDNTLKLGIVSVQADKKDAADDVNGVNEIDTTFTGAVLDKDSKVVAMHSDCVAISFEFDKKGAAVVENMSSVSSKRALGDNYGMKKAGAKKEWYEQADAFDNACKGLNADEIAKLATDKGYGNEDLTNAGCTINISDMVKSAVKAAK